MRAIAAILLVGAAFICGCGGSSDQGTERIKPLSRAQLHALKTQGPSPADRRKSRRILRELRDSIVVHHPPGAPTRELTEREASALKRAVLRDPLVRRLTEGSQVKVGRAVEWHNETGTQLLGAAVTLKLSPAIELNHRQLPVYFTPNPQAPPGTPDLRRKILYSATGVTEMHVGVLLAAREVVEIEPGPFPGLPGPHMKITENSLLGLDPGDDYVPDGD